MKVFKRNAVVITVLLFVCVAVYLNWSYSRGQELSVDAKTTDDSASVTEDAETGTKSDTDSEDDTGTDTDTEDQDSSSLYYEEDSNTSASDYFATARLTRAQARDAATALLQEAATVDAASQEEIDSALNSITAMANYSIQEAQIENMLLAKDFDDCVVFISGEGVNVIVPAPEEGLSDESVAVITETVVSELGVTADQIKIIEVN